MAFKCPFSRREAIRRNDCECRFLVRGRKSFLNALVKILRLQMITFNNLKPWIQHLRHKVYLHTKWFFLPSGCVPISEDDLSNKFYIKVIKCEAQETNHGNGECIFLMIRWGLVSHLYFWMILRERLKMLRL